ncbi:MAG: polysaccharide deacetylase family protein [Paraprevotella sp.]|nr:polysaccharide deacetylase family protein [Bacteroidaceae bacterium]MCI6372453.1 polysaccharide deacetylase family protein [Paraprevotella sp.]MCI7082323.1 polysaccharide deacetylase family protein [Paraprevotella sp.]MCI7142905.1 polysaccharide deacetylase family protein [Paraprevotella sp.]MCI7748184.1 polysaccharide deacetylase family protein [Paraprevotella sp.]
MIIEQPAVFLRWIYPHALWRMDKREKAVYLTFDDGPIPEATPFILDTLERYGAKATFFMVGENARKYPHLLAEVKARGHRIGNHTNNHIGGFRWWSWLYLANVVEANKVLHTNLFRPPHGWMKMMQYRVLRHCGFRVVMWDVVTRDYSRRLTAEDVLNNVRRYTRPGSIITFHDSLKSIDKLKHALPEALQWLIQEGYEFKVFD